MQKRVNGHTDVTFPTVKNEKANLKAHVEVGEITIGEEVVPTTYEFFSVNAQTNTLEMHKAAACARKIPLIAIREKET